MGVLFESKPERRVDALEERRDLRMPAPPEVPGDLLERQKVVRKRVRYAEASGVRFRLLSLFCGRLHE